MCCEICGCSDYKCGCDRPKYIPESDLRKLVVELPTVSEQDISSYTTLLRENGYGSGARFIEGVVKLLERTS